MCIIIKVIFFYRIRLVLQSMKIKKACGMWITERCLFIMERNIKDFIFLSCIQNI